MIIVITDLTASLLKTVSKPCKTCHAECQLSWYCTIITQSLLLIIIVSSETGRFWSLARNGPVVAVCDTLRMFYYVTVVVDGSTFNWFLQMNILTTVCWLNLIDHIYYVYLNLCYLVMCDLSIKLQWLILIWTMYCGCQRIYLEDPSLWTCVLFIAMCKACSLSVLRLPSGSIPATVLISLFVVVKCGCK